MSVEREDCRYQVRDLLASGRLSELSNVGEPDGDELRPSCIPDPVNRFDYIAPRDARMYEAVRARSLCLDGTALDLRARV